MLQVNHLPAQMASAICCTHANTSCISPYSAERWTAWTHERMQEPVNQEKMDAWARFGHLCQNALGTALRPAEALGRDSSPISTTAQPFPGQRFDSTTLPTQVTGEDATYKPALGSNTVLASVPDQDSALFIALDDHLGILDDLSMQSAGPALELSQFEEQHLHKLTIAQHIELLAGVDFSPLESEMRLSPEAFHAFKQKAQDYLTAKARYLKELNRPTDGISRIRRGPDIGTAPAATD